MSLPLISIITTSFNKGKFISDCVESVRQLHYPNIEHIIMDGGSTDNTIAYLKSLKGNVKWVSEPDKGQSNAFNKGLRLSTGAYIGWINADDVYYPDAFNGAVEMLDDNPSAAVVYGNGDIVNESRDIVAEWIAPASMHIKEQLAKNHIFQPSTLIRRSTLVREGGLDESLIYAQDYDLWFKLGRNHSFIHTDIFMSAWREHDNALSVKDHDRQIAEWVRVKLNWKKELI